MANTESVTETLTADAPPQASSDLIYGLEDQPPIPNTIFAALQHVLASFTLLAMIQSPQGYTVVLAANASIA